MQNNTKTTIKKRVFSGTRATGRLHLGNYLGAVKGYIELQEREDLECIYMAMDLHTITTPFDEKTLSQATRDVVMDYLAAGLDPQKSIITLQSLVPEHVYLAYLFSSLVSVAGMSHLPTFKEKVKQHPENVTMALLNYPVLMAADILLYKSNLVPAGIDQEPHIEVTREIARRFNSRFGQTFPEVKRFETSGTYIPSLTGQGKMSKSVAGSSINLVDDLGTIQKKLAKMPTDGGQGEVIPTSGGVANLFKLVELFLGKAERSAAEDLYLTTGVRYGELKATLAEAIFGELAPIQARRHELEKNPAYVEQVIADGAKRAQVIAAATLAEVKEKMGLI